MAKPKTPCGTLPEWDRKTDRKTGQENGTGKRQDNDRTTGQV